MLRIKNRDFKFERLEIKEKYFMVVKIHLFCEEQK